MDLKNVKVICSWILVWNYMQKYKKRKYNPGLPRHHLRGLSLRPAYLSNAFHISPIFMKFCMNWTANASG
jgi:hypothetical protein